jgi:hypothetical protein
MSRGLSQCTYIDDKDHQKNREDNQGNEAMSAGFCRNKVPFLLCFSAANSRPNSMAQDSAARFGAPGRTGKRGHRVEVNPYLGHAELTQHIAAQLLIETPAGR